MFEVEGLKKMSALRQRELDTINEKKNEKYRNKFNAFREETNSRLSYSAMHGRDYTIIDLPRYVRKKFKKEFKKELMDSGLTLVDGGCALKIIWNYEKYLSEREE